MEFSVKNFPELPGTGAFAPIEQGEISAMAISLGNAFGVNEGDRIEFNVFDANGNVAMFTKETGSTKRDGSPAKGRWIACTKNGVPSYIGLGTLMRTDAKVQFVTDFAKELSKACHNNVGELQAYLKDKKIVATAPVSYQRRKFGTTENEPAETVNFKWE